LDERWQINLWRAGNGLKAVAVGKKEIHKCPEEIGISSGHLCISGFDLCIFVEEIGISSRGMPIWGSESPISFRET